jgi:hypothetical protein
MEPKGRTGAVTRRLWLGLALVMAPALSACASLGLFQSEPPVVSEAPPGPPPVVEPPRPAEFPELAVGAQIVDAPMSEPPSQNEPPATSTTPPTPMAAPRRPAPPRQASLQPPTPPASATPRTVEPADLVGFNFDSVLGVLRQPDAVEKNALSVVWTYAGSDCTLQLYFYPDIQTAVFRLLKYELKGTSGEKLNESGACMQPMMAMRKDGPQLQR